MFGNNFKYVLALGFLATFVYTSPAVADSISSGIAYDNQQAAVWDSWFGFGNHANAPVSPQMVQTFGTSTNMMPPFASSTRPMRNGDDNNQGQGNRMLNPQDVITILYKAGLISADNLNQARQLFPQPTEVGSSTIQGLPIRARFAPPQGQFQPGIGGQTPAPEQGSSQ